MGKPNTRFRVFYIIIRLILTIRKDRQIDILIFIQSNKIIKLLCTFTVELYDAIACIAHTITHDSLNNNTKYYTIVIQYVIEK